MDPNEEPDAPQAIAQMLASTDDGHEGRQAIVEAEAAHQNPQLVLLCNATTGTPPTTIQTTRSTTQRCRARFDWAKNNLGTNDEFWVCSKGGCTMEVCAMYRQVKHSVPAGLEITSEEKETEEIVSEQQDLDKAVKNTSEEKPSDATSAKDKIIADVRQQLQNKKIHQMNKKIHQMNKKIHQQDVEIHQMDVKIHQRNKEIHQHKKNALVSKCNELNGAHKGVNDFLLHGKIAGNQTTYFSQRTNHDELEAEAAAADAQMPMNEPRSPSGFDQDRVSPPQARNNKDYFQSEVLGEFYTYCEEMFKAGKSVPVKVPYESMDFQDHIRVTIELIESWESGTRWTGEKKVYIPAKKAQETNAVQPILLSLMSKISSILKGTMHLTKEQIVPKQRDRSRRYIDANMSSVPTQYLALAFGSLLGKFVEIKPLARKNESYMQVTQRGNNQILGHNCEVLYESHFHFFGGLGRDGSSEGIVLTIASSQIQSATLKGVGTSKVKLAVIKGKTGEPLFSRESTLNLFGGDAAVLNATGLTFLPPEEGKVVFQNGFKDLVNFIMNSKDETPGLDGFFEMVDKEGTKDVSEVKTAATATADSGTSSSIDVDTIPPNGTRVRLGKYLGEGAFSTVYAGVLPEGDGDGNSVVLKVAKGMGSKKSLDNELETLQQLSHASIPKAHFKQLAKLTIEQRCEKNTLECLVLDVPVGRTARDWIQQRTPKSEIPSVTRKVFNVGNDVLQYAHRRGIYSLDVNPSNILIVAKHNDYNVYLNDWGTAWHSKQKEMSGFRGCPPFAHDDILNLGRGETWKGEAKYDYCSLALTCASLLSGGEVPWHGFHRSRGVSMEELLNRRNKAKEILQAISETGAVKYLAPEVPEWIMHTKDDDIDTLTVGKLSRIIFYSYEKVKSGAGKATLQTDAKKALESIRRASKVPEWIKNTEQDGLVDLSKQKLIEILSLSGVKVAGSKVKKAYLVKSAQRVLTAFKRGHLPSNRSPQQGSKRLRATGSPSPDSKRVKNL